MKIKTDSFIKISQIIARDSKDTSYKFALLRATIDVIELYDHHIIQLGKKVSIPIGLIIERWLWYYYPLIDSEIFFPQKNGEPEKITPRKNIAFRQDFVNLIFEFDDSDKFNYFYNEYKKKRLSPEVYRKLKVLIDKLYGTITKMPMKYIGKSVSKEEYSIYQLDERKMRNRNGRIIDTEFLLRNYGTVLIPYEFYMVFKYLGGFIEGSNAIINSWAEFILKANKSIDLKKTDILEKLLYDPEITRDVNHVKSYFHQQQDLNCVWSGKKIGQNQLHIDHVLPFTHYLNNDIWNLLPAISDINSNKRDKIPTSFQLSQSKELIMYYWSDLNSSFQDRFKNEVHIGLIPKLDFKNSDWQISMFEALQEKASFLINIRGLESWQL